MIETKGASKSNINSWTQISSANRFSNDDELQVKGISRSPMQLFSNELSKSKKTFLQQQTKLTDHSQEPPEKI